jgi:hypothetical protein
LRTRRKTIGFRWADDSRNSVTDTLGREIDGTDDGQPGGDCLATINGTRVTTGGAPFARTQRQPAGVADVVDRLLVRGDLAKLTPSLRKGPPRHAGA